MSPPSDVLIDPSIISTVLYINLILICGAIFIGCLLLIRRFKSRDMTGVSEIDYNKIASQLNTEIKDLIRLRNSIDPDGNFDNSGLEAPVAQNGISSEEFQALSEEEMIVHPAVQAAIKKESEKAAEEAQLKIQELEEKVSSQGASASEDENSEVVEMLKAELEKSTDQLEESKKEIIRLQEDMKELSEETKDTKTAPAETQKMEEKIKDLESRVQEYAIFENDFALVKQYKSENEELREKLNKLKGEDDVSAISTPPNIGAEKEVVAAKETPDREEVPEVLPEETAQKESTEEFEEEKVSAEPVVEHDAEALAESASEDDELMAEFEKLLGDKPGDS